MNRALLTLTGVYCAALVISQVLAAKLAKIWDDILPAGFAAYALTFAITDIVSRVYDRDRPFLKRYSFWIVVTGFLANLAVLPLILLAVELPAAPLPSMTSCFLESYSRIMWQGVCITLASWIAYWISQTHDIAVFHLIDRLVRYRMRWLWVSSLGSTVISQAIDTFIFITLAFYVLPRYLPGMLIPDFNVVLHIVWSQWKWKAMMALCYLALVYAAVLALNKRSHPKEASSISSARD